MLCGRYVNSYLAANIILNLLVFSLIIKFILLTTTTKKCEVFTLPLEGGGDDDEHKTEVLDRFKFVFKMLLLALRICVRCCWRLLLSFLRLLFIVAVVIVAAVVVVVVVVVIAAPEVDDELPFIL